MMGQKYCIGELGRLGADRTGQRFIQQRGCHSGQRDKNQRTEQGAEQLFIHGQVYQPQDKHRCQDGLYLIFQRQEGHAKEEFRDMYSYQAVIPALHMERDADEQCYDPGQHRGLAQSPLQKREQQVQKQDAAEEPLAYTGEIHTHPASGHGKVVETQKGQHQRDGLGPGVVAGLTEEADGKADHPCQPEQWEHRLGPLLVKLPRALFRRDSERQRCARHDKKQRRAEITEVNALHQRAGEQLVRQGEIPGNGGVEVDN